MRVDDYMLTLDMGSIDVNPRHKIDVSLIAEDYLDLADAVDVLKRASASNDVIVFGSPIPVPEKIFRCGDVTTVIWKDGTKTTVKLMPGADDSDYGAFTAALAKKIYGNNSKVMRYAGMVRRVKSKAEKKAERKAKHKAETEKQYIVSQFGQVYEYRGAEDESLGYGQKVFVHAESEDEARSLATVRFRKGTLMEWVVFDDTTTYEVYGCTDDMFGKWKHSSGSGLFVTAVFAKDAKEAEKVLSTIPAPIQF